MQFSNVSKSGRQKGWVYVWDVGGLEDGGNNFSRSETVAQTTKSFRCTTGESVLQQYYFI